MTITPETAVKIAGNIKVWQSEIAELEEAVKNAKAKLAELGEETHLVGDFKIEVYTSRRFDAKLAERTLSPERWEAISVPGRTTTAALAKKVLSDEEFASVQTVSKDRSVKVDLRDE